MAGTPYIVDRGVVLRETETKETDKILTLLTWEQGKIAVIARGARRKQSKFGAAAQPLAYSEWTLHQRKDWHFAGDASTQELFSGLRGDLAALALGLVKPAFELRLLCLAGYEPLADACALCGKEDPEEPVVDTVQGVLRCRGCGGGGGRPLCPDSLAALRHIVYGDTKRLYAFRLGEEPLRRLTAASEAFLYAQLERGFGTLDFYKSIL